MRCQNCGATQGPDKRVRRHSDGDVLCNDCEPTTCTCERRHPVAEVAAGVGVVVFCGTCGRP